eukprot:gene7612-1361_t
MPIYYGDGLVARASHYNAGPHFDGTASRRAGSYFSTPVVAGSFPGRTSISGTGYPLSAPYGNGTARYHRPAYNSWSRQHQNERVLYGRTPATSNRYNPWPEHHRVNLLPGAPTRQYAPVDHAVGGHLMTVSDYNEWLQDRRQLGTIPQLT